MKGDKNNVVIFKRFNKKVVPLKDLQINGEQSSKKFLDLKAFDKNFQIGSTLPRASLTYYAAPKVIRPPSEIFAQPILRAAFEIDMQTASIPWEDINLTLKSSKNSLTRMQEMYHNPKHPYPVKETIQESDSSVELSLRSHRSSIREEIKSIFNNKIMEKELKKPKKRPIRSASLSNFKMSKPRPATSGKVEELMIGSLLVKKIDHNRVKTAVNGSFVYDKQNNVHRRIRVPYIGDTKLTPTNISVQIKKKNVVISESAAFQLFDNFSIFDDKGFNAPYAGRMRGNKVQSKFGAMFIPAASGTITPNHFLNNAD